MTGLSLKKENKVITILDDGFEYSQNFSIINLQTLYFNNHFQSLNNSWPSFRYFNKIFFGVCPSS
jgi:hypothetical protein